jgi:UbiD family decarboxylase
MTLLTPAGAPGGTPTRYKDLRQHLADLESAGLLRRVSRPINKDTEMHPLVRVQFLSQMPEAERRAWLFERVTDAKGKQYDIPVVVGALAASRQVYAVGMGVPPDELDAAWNAVLGERIAPELVSGGPVQEVVHERGTPGGVDLGFLPVPISTPGFDNGPYLTAAHWFVKYPKTGVRNQGNYRAMIKGPDRIGVSLGKHSGSLPIWKEWARLGEPMPVALVIGAPPLVSYAVVTKLEAGDDELALAGALAGHPIPLVRCRTVDLEVPADSEIVIEGYLETDYIEPEGPFGESHGYVHLRQDMPVLQVTAITHRRNPVYSSFVSQVTPSESSTIKKVGYEPLFLRHLRVERGLRSVRRVAMIEPLLNLRPMLVIQFAEGAPRRDVWRALYAAATFHTGVGKLVIGVSPDIDPHDLHSVLWAMVSRANFGRDLSFVEHMGHIHGPLEKQSGRQESEERHLLVDATLKEPYPPVALPKREYMEHALELWRELGLGEPTLRSPWHGYTLGMWTDDWEQEAQWAVQGEHYAVGAKLAGLRRPVSEEDLR